MYADDLNAFVEVEQAKTNVEALEEAKDCQKKLHKWGRANQVAFDSSKKSFHILSQRQPEGENFKLLDVYFDCELRMKGAVHELVNEANCEHYYEEITLSP